ncbi:MAG: hypothetical protein ABL940_07010 [Bacteroidia bacterium]
MRTIVSSIIQKCSVLLLLLVMSTTIANAQFYYGSQQDFGKNRIQHKQFLWSQFNFEKYDLFFYQNGKPIAQYAAQIIDRNYEALQEKFEVTIDDKIHVVLYNKQSDYKQSNIGLSNSADNNVAGTLNVVGNEVFLYFDGNYANFEIQIKKALTELIINQLLYGGSLREMARNKALINVPDWYLKGLAAYTAEPWNYTLDNQVRDAMLAGKYNDITRLTNTQSTLAGHSLWQYIAETYGANTITNLLYMTRYTRNVDNGMMYVLGVSYKNLLDDWKEYYINKNMLFDRNRDAVPITDLLLKTKKQNTARELKISPDGKYIAYCTNNNGKTIVNIVELSTKKKTKIFTTGQKLNRDIDATYPVLAWHPTSEFISIISEELGGIWLNNYTIETHKTIQRELFNFEKILSVNYSSDGKKMALSAVQQGFSDIYVYNVGSNSIEQITKDIYNDLQPIFINKGHDIVFASNRTDDTIHAPAPKAPMQVMSSMQTDLFQYNYVTKNTTLKRLTNTPDNEHSPLLYDKAHVLFLSDYNGITQRNIATFDSTIDYIDTAVHYKYTMNYKPITNYNRAILTHDVNGGKQAELILNKSVYELHVYDYIKPEALATKAVEATPYYLAINNNRKKTYTYSPLDSTIIPVVNKKNTDPNYIDIEDYVFEFEKQKTPETTSSGTIINNSPSTSNTATPNVVLGAKDSSTVRSKLVNEFIYPKQLNYNKFFTVDYLVTQVDNTMLASNYQTYVAGQPFFNPGVNGFVKLGTSDLFQNERFTGGFRLGTNLKSNEFFGAYEQLAKRWDRTYLYHRQSIENSNGAYSTHTRTNELKLQLKYPFNEITSFKTTFTLRNDQLSTYATDALALQRKSIFTTWAIAKTEYVIDDSQTLGMNLPTGTRFKAFAEYYQQVNKIKNNVFIVGLDYRKYVKIHRELLWASRVAASSSLLSNQKLIYYLGGVDNWLYPKTKFNTDTRVDNTQNYVFQTIATNMRGFIQNVRNGNNFAVINEEIRFPFVRYFSKKPLSSEFWNNLQLIGFYDLGMAWSGSNPNSDQNILFTKTIKQSNITYVLKNYESPIIMGFGGGFRFKLAGYFVRLDWARGVKDGALLQKNVFYASFGLDF